MKKQPWGSSKSFLNLTRTHHTNHQIFVLHRFYQPNTLLFTPVLYGWENLSIRFDLSNRSNRKWNLSNDQRCGKGGWNCFRRSGVYRTRNFARDFPINIPCRKIWTVTIAFVNGRKGEEIKNMAVIATLSTFKAKSSASFVRLRFFAKFQCQIKCKLCRIQFSNQWKDDFQTKISMLWFILGKGHTNVRCAIKICTNRFHTEEKPFKCKQCDQVFTQEIYFIHIREKPYECTKC